jgi:hypothetical protein
MNEPVDTQEIESCPLCESFEEIELNEAMQDDKGTPIWASVYSRCCSVQVSAPTLDEAIVKWNKLCSCEDNDETPLPG